MGSCRELQKCVNGHKEGVESSRKVSRAVERCRKLQKDFDSRRQNVESLSNVLKAVGSY